MTATTVLQTGAISVYDYRCSAGPHSKPFVEQHFSHSIAYVRKGSFCCTRRGTSFELVAGSLMIGHPGGEYICSHDHHVCGDECLSFAFAPELVEEIGGSVANRVRGAVARTDGARRTGAGGSRWPQRYRTGRGRPRAGQPVCRGGIGTA